MPDRRSLESTLDALEKRTGMRAGATVFLDRGIAFDENLSQIRQRGSHYIVARRQSERNEWLDEREQDDDWETLDCGPSARNRFQKKSRVEVKRRRKGDLVYLLCCVFQRS